MTAKMPIKKTHPIRTCGTVWKKFGWTALINSENSGAVYNQNTAIDDSREEKIVMIEITQKDGVLKAL